MSDKVCADIPEFATVRGISISYVEKIARMGIYLYGLDIDDFIQEAYFVYVECQKTYDPKKGKFTTHFYNNWRGKFSQLMRSNRSRDKREKYWLKRQTLNCNKVVDTHSIFRNREELEIWESFMLETEITEDSRRFLKNIYDPEQDLYEYIERHRRPNGALKPPLIKLLRNYYNLPFKKVREIKEELRSFAQSAVA